MERNNSNTFLFHVSLREKLLISDRILFNSNWDFPTQNIFFRPFSQHDVKTEKIHLKNHAMHELNLILCLLTRVLSVSMSSGQFSSSLSTKQFNSSSKEWRCLTRISFHFMFWLHRRTISRNPSTTKPNLHLTMSTWELFCGSFTT